MARMRSEKKPSADMDLDGKYVRIVRKGNGYVAQELTLPDMTISDIGDWDLRSVTEVKALNRLIANSRK